MYFSEPAADGPTIGVPGLPTTLVLAVTVTATVVLGVVPGAVLDMAEQAAKILGWRTEPAPPSAGGPPTDPCNRTPTPAPPFAPGVPVADPDRNGAGWGRGVAFGE